MQRICCTWPAECNAMQQWLRLDALANWHTVTPPGPGMTQEHPKALHHSSYKHHCECNRQQQELNSKTTNTPGMLLMVAVALSCSVAVLLLASLWFAQSKLLHAPVVADSVPRPIHTALPLFGFFLSFCSCFFLWPAASPSVAVSGCCCFALTWQEAVGSPTM